jgi:hypothetical protein
MTTTSDFNYAIRQLIGNITDPLEQEISTKLVYQRTSYHKVKLIPFHEEWIIDPCFEPVKQALVKLSSIRFAVNAFRTQLKSVPALRVIMYVDRVYHDLFKCLIFNGCKDAPDHITERFVTVETISMELCFALAAEINGAVLK